MRSHGYSVYSISSEGSGQGSPEFLTFWQTVIQPDIAVLCLILPHKINVTTNKLTKIQKPKYDFWLCRVVSAEIKWLKLRKYAGKVQKNIRAFYLKELQIQCLPCFLFPLFLKVPKQSDSPVFSLFSLSTQYITEHTITDFFSAN